MCPKGVELVEINKKKFFIDHLFYKVFLIFIMYFLNKTTNERETDFNEINIDRN